jgi:nucleosome assembly protein 1-like 1
MEQDFEIGGIIVDECVPYSLEYYLGVKAEGEDEDFEDDDDDDDDEGKDEGKGDSEDEPPKKNKSKGKGDKAAAGKAGQAAPTDQKPECKQQ